MVETYSAGAGEDVSVFSSSSSSRRARSSASSCRRCCSWALAWGGVCRERRKSRSSLLAASSRVWGRGGVGGVGSVGSEGWVVEDWLGGGGVGQVEVEAGEELFGEEDEDQSQPIAIGWVLVEMERTYSILRKVGVDSMYGRV